MGRDGLSWADAAAWAGRRGGMAPLRVGWRHRELIIAMLRREVADRFSGSAFGWIWAIGAPLLTLAIYTLTFTRAMPLPVASAQGGTAHYALSTFVGLIVFGVFAELSCRASLLLHEHAWFLKTSIFPSETLAWTAVFRALVYSGISLVLLIAFQLALDGSVPLSLLLVPVIIVPFVLFLVGLVWFLAAVGAFTRDLSYLMITFVPLLMLATPVFYRASDLPPGLRLAALINPIGATIELLRSAILGGSIPLVACLGLTIISVAVFRGGYAVFQRYKGIVVDVI